MTVKEEFIKIGFSLETKEFYMYGDGRFAERCFIYDRLKDDIASEDLSIYEGLRQLRELSVFYPKRFVLVFDDVVLDSSTNDKIPSSSGDDIPF